MDDLNKRITKVNQQIRQIIKQQEKETARRYARVLATIRAELAKQYEKYEKDGKLSMQEMLKFERLKKLNQRMEHILTAHYKGFGEQIKSALGNTYQDGYYQTAYNLEMHVKKKIGYRAVRPETLKAMLDNPVNGLTLNQRLQQRRAYVIQQIQRQVTLGLQNNESYSTMTKRLKGELEGDAVKAMRIVRTEGHRVQESAKHDAMDFADKNGVVMVKQWNSLEDERVRPAKGKGGIANHRKLNNKKIAMNQLFDDGLSKGPAPGQLPAAASSINCRCFLTYSVEKVVKKDLKDIEAATFAQWKKENIKEVEIPEEQPKKEEKPTETKKVEEMTMGELRTEARRLGLKDRGEGVTMKTLINSIKADQEKATKLETLKEVDNIKLTTVQKKKVEFTNNEFAKELKTTNLLSKKQKEEYLKRFENGDFENKPVKLHSEGKVVEFELINGFWVGYTDSDWDKKRDFDWAMNWLKNNKTGLDRLEGMRFILTDELDSSVYMSRQDEINMFPFFEGDDNEEIEQRRTRFKKTFFHELGHRVHQIPGEKLMVNESDAEKNGLTGNINKEQWKQFKKHVDKWYKDKGQSVDPEISRLGYALNAKNEYKKGTKQHFYMEMFAEGTSIYMENNKEDHKLVEKHLPGFLDFFESIYKYNFIKK